MSQAFKCDQCKRYFDGEWRNKIEVFLDRRHSLSKLDQELCPECWDKYLRFIGQQPQPTEEETHD